MRKTIATLITLLISTSLFATEPHGFVKTSIMMGVRGENSGKFLNRNVRTQINIDHDLGEDGNVTASFDILYEKLINSEPELRIIPVELYAQYSGDYWGVKAGKYYDFWGLFEWISPNDIINPWDMGHISSDIEDYRISTYGINFSMGNDIINFELNLLPLFEASIFPGFEMIKEKPAEKKERNKIKSTEIAGKLAGTINSIGLDWDLYYFRGHKRSPDIVVETYPPQGTGGKNPQISQNLVYQKINLWGVDMSYPISSLLLKLEAAYVETEDKKGENPFLENPYFSIVAGFDWAAMPELTFFAAYKLKSYTEYNKNIDSGIDRNQNLFMLSVKYQPKDYINFQWIALFRRDDKSFFSLPFISYSLIDDFTVTAGAVLFYGREDSEFGKMRDYSNLLVEIKGSF